MLVLDIIAPPKTPDLNCLLNEAGGHRIQRIPPGEKRGRVHSSTVTVSVLDQSRPNTLQAQEFPEHDFQITFFSGTGPGGQNRNKVQASARITHLPSGLVRSAQTRSRKNSVALAMSALREDLLKLYEGTHQATQNGTRKDQVGSGMRGDKRRTYRFQENVVHDHMTGKRTDLRRAMTGQFENLWE